MRKYILIVLIVVVAMLAGFFLTPKEHTNPDVATNAVKAYAAFQFSVPLDKVTVLSTSKEMHWDTICMGMTFKDYNCAKANVTGYEVGVRVNGKDMKYRSYANGTVIRFVK